MATPVPTAPTGVDADAWVQAVEDIRGYCRWHIAPEHTETITVDGPGGQVLFLPTLHMTDLASITNDGTAVTDPEWSAAGMVRTDSSWSTKFRAIEVTLTHGYEIWPYELEALALGIVSASGRGGAKQVSSGTHQVSFEESLTASQRATLARYRRALLP